MVELIILDENFGELGSITTFSGLQWTQKLNEPGSYKLITGENIDLLLAGEYIVRNDEEQLAIINLIDYDKLKKQVTASGFLFENRLNDRVIDVVQDINSNAELLMRQLITTFAVTGDKTIPYLELGTLNSLGSTIRVQTTGDELGAKLYEIAQSQDLSIRTRYDYLLNKIYFEVWQGLDRTDNQTINSLAVFSENEGNVTSVVYTKNSEDVKNFAYVAGEGEGVDRAIKEVDLTNGEDRKELWVDARDLQQGDLTTAEYQEALYQRGVEKLADYNLIQSVYFDVTENSNLIYGTDYNLGDLVTFQDDELTVDVDIRITEVTEIFEKNGVTVSVILGDENKTEIEKIKRVVT